MSGPVPDLVVTGRRIVLPEGLAEAAIVVVDGRVEAVVEPSEAPPATRTIDAGDLVVLPGLVDTHVHVNEPGRTHWEGFESATRAALAGGVTTIVDMPLNSIPATTSVSALQLKREAAAGRCSCDVGFWGGIVPGNTAELEPMVRAGALGFKAFLVPSGVDEFPAVSEADLRRAAEITARLKVPLLIHAEDPEAVAHATLTFSLRDRRSHRSWLRSRAGEDNAVCRLRRLCLETGARIHVVHIASHDALEYVYELPEGHAFSVETCPHYLTFASEEIPDGATQFKCAPPIHRATNRDALWYGLAHGVITMIVSDHSPCPPELKRLDEGDFFTAWGGIASLQLGLSAVWTGARDRGYGPVELARWMSAAPARLAGLGRKGAIAAGRDADFVLWDPEAEWTVHGEQLEHRHKLTPYEGHALRGRVLHTFLRGVEVFDGEAFPAGAIGREVERSGRVST